MKGFLGGKKKRGEYMNAGVRGVFLGKDKGKYMFSNGKKEVAEECCHHSNRIITIVIWEFSAHVSRQHYTVTRNAVRRCMIHFRGDDTLSPRPQLFMSDFTDNNSL